MDKLKPCPFCGKDSTIHESCSDSMFHWFVMCEGCGTASDVYINKSQAIKAWNTRKEEPSNEEDR